MDQVDVLIHGKIWAKKYANLAKSVLFKCLDFLKIPAEISVLLTNDEEITALNYQYRKQNKPTNVLSFETKDSQMLGDIVLSFETVEKEAIFQKKTFENHLTHLLIHGLLHLLGRDHLDEKEAQKMEVEEADLLLNLFKIQNPYKENN
ncbi:MAG: rRNA maturation RNase YbeY [Alphaproteobacteria bacterium]